nr:acid ceramidase 1 [Nephotettix cincticeps]
MLWCCNLILLIIALFCILSEAQTGSTSKDNEETSYQNNVLSQYFFLSKTNRSEMLQDKESLETNDINDAVGVDTLGIELDVFYKDFRDQTNRVDTSLIFSLFKKIETDSDNWRRLKYEKAAKNQSLNTSFKGCSKDPYPPPTSKSIKTFNINLDAPPEDRWKEVVQKNLFQLKKLTEMIERSLGPVVMSAVDTAMTWLHYLLPSEYHRELNGLSLASGVSVARVTLFNVFYEISAFCTSIVMEAEDGKIYHGRNLDFGIVFGWDAKNHTWFITEILRPLIIKVNFFKNGKPLYSSVTYAGYTGILTGIKKNAFSLTINERYVTNGGYLGIAEWFMGIHNQSWLGLLTRRVMETAESYDKAQELLSNTPLVAPVYFILAGNTSSQGVILTRSRRDSDIWPLGSKHQQQKGDWFLVETNYDHWKETPFHDHRREYAVQCMDDIGREKPLETLYRVLSTQPVLNKETTYTAVMDVREGLLEVWERDCPDPCWPL